MPEFIKQRKRHTAHRYEQVWVWPTDPHSGWGFECDAQGNIVTPEHPEGRENLRKCQAGEQGVYKGMEHYTWVYYEDAIIRCQCGGEVTLYDPMTNECDCGRLYNGFGQQLAPREQWDMDLED